MNPSKTTYCIQGLQKSVYQSCRTHIILNVFCRASNFPFSFSFSHWAILIFMDENENGNLLALLKKIFCQLNKKMIKLKLAQDTQTLRTASLKGKLEFKFYFMQILVLHTCDKITFLLSLSLVGFILFTAIVVMMFLCWGLTLSCKTIMTYWVTFSVM